MNRLKQRKSAAAGSSFTSGDESSTQPSNATSVTPSPTASQDQAPSAQDDADAIVGLNESILDSDNGTSITAAGSDELSSAELSAEQSNAEQSSAEQSSPEQNSPEQSGADSEQTAAAEQTANANVLELTFNEQSWTEILMPAINVSSLVCKRLAPQRPSKASPVSFNRG